MVVALSPGAGRLGVVLRFIVALEGPPEVAKTLSEAAADLRQFAGAEDQPCDRFHFWSYHPGGANFALCDGSVRFITHSGDAVLPALATRAGKETVTVP